MRGKDLLSKVPPEILLVTEKLRRNGFEAFLVGGCVRDLVLGNDPKDFDVATNAQPSQISEIFPQSVGTYAKFGTVLVLAKDEEGETQSVEVTTYRSETDYRDGRWPAEVEFTDDLTKDLGRRDFTINSMALSPFDGELVDLFSGQKDLKKGIINAVGTPKERLLEDGLRGFRACRLAATLEFTIHTETFKAIKNHLDVAAQVSVERICDEFVRLLMEAPKPSVGIELLRETGLLKIFFPELMEGIGVTQPEFHLNDVYEHTLTCVDVSPDEVKLAALFHDIAKPRCYILVEDEVHFYGHDIKGARMTREIMRRLKFSRAEIEKTARLVRWHMFIFQKEWTDAAVRRFIKRVGEENVDLLFELRIADAVCNPKSSFSVAEVEALQERIAEVRKKEMALKVEDLAISGYDLMKLGTPEGPKIGKILNQLLEKVLEDPGLNRKERLLELAKKHGIIKEFKSQSAKRKTTRLDFGSPRRTA